MTHVELDSRSAAIESAPLSSLTPAAILPRLPTLSLALILLYGPLKTLSRPQDPQDRPGSRPRGAERENESPGELTSGADGPPRANVGRRGHGTGPRVDDDPRWGQDADVDGASGKGMRAGARRQGSGRMGGAPASERGPLLRYVSFLFVYSILTKLFQLNLWARTTHADNGWWSSGRGPSERARAPPAVCFFFFIAFLSTNTKPECPALPPITTAQDGDAMTLRTTPANHEDRRRQSTRTTTREDDSDDRRRRRRRASTQIQRERAGTTAGWQAKQRVDCHLNRSVSPASFLSLLNFMLSYSWTWYLCNSVLCLCMTLCPIFAALCVLMRFLISLCIFLFVMPLCLYGDLYMLFMSLQWPLRAFHVFVMTLTCLCDDLYALMTLCRLLGSLQLLFAALQCFLPLCNALHPEIPSTSLSLCNTFTSLWLLDVFTTHLHKLFASCLCTHFVVLTFLPLSHNSYSLRCLSALISALFAIYLSGSSWPVWLRQVKWATSLNVRSLSGIKMSSKWLRHLN